MDPLPHHLTAGTLIGGRYSVEGVLGEGGFGITYLTKDNKLGSLFAIKEYYPRGVSYRDQTGTNTVYVSSKDDTEFYDHGKKRFLSEARTLAKFSEEPGVVSVTDYIEENDTVYLVMEYLRGDNLQQYLKKHGKLSADEAFSMLEPVIKTLEKIHAAGIIHRDISPDNIMVLKNGQLKLMDFGASKEFVDDNRSMSVMLKKGYAPMEQYRRNGKQGPWTDVYAMCATIYRCITGKTPDDALDRVVEDTLKKPSELGADITPAREQVLLYGLAVHQNDRCQSMTELLKLWNQQSPDFSSRSNAAAGGSQPDAYATVYADTFRSDPNATVYAGNSQIGGSAPVSVPIQPTPVSAPIPAAAPAPKKKGKKGVVIGIVAAVLVIAIGAGVILLKPWESLNGASKSKGSVEPTFSNAHANYYWKVTDAFWNTSKDDLNNDLTRVSKNKKIYLHFNLKSNPSGGSTMPVIKLNKPDGTQDVFYFSEKKNEGWLWFSWEWDDPEKAKAGTLSATIYDETGSELRTVYIDIID